MDQFVSRRPDQVWVKLKETKKSFVNVVDRWLDEGAARDHVLAGHSSWVRVGSAEHR